MAYHEDQIESIFSLIIQRIEDGEALRTILKSEDMPSTQTFYRWLESNDLKSKQYACACEVRGDAIFDEIIEIADDSKNDFTEKDIGDGIVVSQFNSENVQRSRLRIDARKWVASKLNPKKYGDTVDFTSGGVALTGIDFNVISKK